MSTLFIDNETHSKLRKYLEDCGVRFVQNGTRELLEIAVDLDLLSCLSLLEEEAKRKELSTAVLLREAVRNILTPSVGKPEEPILKELAQMAKEDGFSSTTEFWSSWAKPIIEASLQGKRHG